MKSSAEILHYMFWVLSRSKYTLRRVYMPEGYSVLLKVGEVGFLYTREDIRCLERMERDKDWPCSILRNLLYKMKLVLAFGTEYFNEGGENDG